MKIKTILLLLSFSFLFIGCTQKEPTIIFKPKLVCFELLKAEPTQEVTIRVHEKDLALFEARKQEIDKTIVLYESQVDRHNTYCAEQLKKGD